MNWLHRIVAMLMLAAWIPAASLCLAECAGVVERGDCCPDESGGKTNAADHSCCFLASGLYKLHDNHSLLMIPDALPTAQVSSHLSVAPSSNSLPLPAARRSPPDLPVSWQFSFRTALPPRAPSFAS